MEKDVEHVPYIVYEGAQARRERTERRLIIALVIAVVLLAASNLLWLRAWVQYDYCAETYTVDVDASEGDANFIGQDGDIVNGTNQGDEGAPHQAA